MLAFTGEAKGHVCLEMHVKGRRYREPGRGAMSEEPGLSSGWHGCSFRLGPALGARGRPSKATPGYGNHEPGIARIESA